MKRLAATLLVLFSSAYFTACSTVEDLLRDINFNVETTSDVSFELPITRVGPLEEEFSSLTYNTDIEKKLKEKDPNLTLSDIRSLKIVECKLTLTNGDLATVDNFAAFETFSIGLAAGNLQYHTFFRMDIPDSPALTISATPNTLDLTPVFKQPGPYRCKLSGKARKVTTKKLQGKMHVVYEITVGA